MKLKLNISKQFDTLLATNNVRFPSGHGTIIHLSMKSCGMSINHSDFIT